MLGQPDLEMLGGKMTGEVGRTNSLPDAKAQDEARGVSAVNMNFKGAEG